MPINKKIAVYEPGIFTWPIILNQTGVCYLFGYGDNTAQPGTHFYNGNIGCPVYNDGLKINATDAKYMAKIFNGYVHVKRSVREDWEKLSKVEQTVLLSVRADAEPPSIDFLNKVERLAKFCEESKGFQIY